VTVRRCLIALAVICTLVGAFAAAAPHAFYRHVIGIDMLGPYNQHLLTDVGGFYLGFALLFAWAARRPTTELTRAACAAFALVQALHFAYHAAHLDGFSAGEAIQQTVALAVLLVLPVGTLVVSRAG
jgi:hypothetical protein